MGGGLRAGTGTDIRRPKVWAAWTVRRLVGAAWPMKAWIGGSEDLITAWFAYSLVDGNGIISTTAATFSLPLLLLLLGLLLNTSVNFLLRDLGFFSRLYYSSIRPMIRLRQFCRCRTPFPFTFSCVLPFPVTSTLLFFCFPDGL